MSERIISFVPKQEEETSFKEKVLTVSKRVDEVQIVAGLVVGLINPVIGGALVGPSLITRVLADSEQKRAREKRITQELQKAAYGGRARI